jgi:two-component system phosphate regulon response regulator PhoB
LQRTILVVEDESAIREMVIDALTRAGFAALEAEHAAQAHEALAAGKPDLILLDWMLPGISGLDFVRRLRRGDRTRSIPVIMLTARGEETDRLAGFEAGVDDYINKPFSLRELIARVNAVLRRSAPASEDAPIQIDGLSLDPVSHRVSVKGQRLKLGPTEFRLLHFLMTHRERVFARAQLLDHVWGTNVVVEERTVDVHIRRLRKALSPHGYDELIQTVHGAGYRFSDQMS